MRPVLGCFVALLSGATIGLSQELPADAAPAAYCRRVGSTTTSDEEHIIQIVQKTLDAGHSELPDGVHVLQFVPLAGKDNDRIVAMGACAVVPLTRILDWQSDFAQLISVRLLAQIKTPESVASLEKAFDPHRWLPVRMSALYGLADTPWNQRTKVIVEDATRDAEPRIREIARSLLIEQHKSS